MKTDLMDIVNKHSEKLEKEENLFVLVNHLNRNDVEKEKEEIREMSVLENEPFITLLIIDVFIAAIFLAGVFGHW